MSRLQVLLSVPFSNETPVSVSILDDATIESVLSRAVHIFSSLGDRSKFDILVLVQDGTYQFTTTDDNIGMYSLHKNPQIIFVPKQFDIEISSEIEQKPIKMTVKSHETVQHILERVCTESGTALKPKNYVLTHDQYVLINALSIVEQRPQAQKLNFIEADSEKVKLNFMELYLKGPVFLSFSDALQLSAYLLQAVQGPFRCFNGTASSLVKFLPRCFHDREKAGDEVQVYWSYLTDCTREEATRKFTDNVQRLPLFNCTSFTCNRLKDDESLPEEFELIFTEKRAIFLDIIKFKTKYSITYDNLIKMIRNEDEIQFEYTDDGSVSKTIKFETNTSRSLFTKLVELADSEQASNNIDLSSDRNEYPFHQLTDIQNDETRFKPFNADFLYKFINMDEENENISYVELMHALTIRAESCSFHLSVLLSKVTVNNVKLYRAEIIEYYIRLMAYLTYMTYDHRPFDAAYKLAKCIFNLEDEIANANQIIRDVSHLIASVSKMFIPISNNPILITSQNAKAHVLGHLLSITEFPYATPTQSIEPFEELRKAFLQNAILMKNTIRKYMFGVGNIETKKNLQATLDNLFKLHLGTLSLLPHIVESTEIGELNPSIIMHQDSCNMMMTTVVEFSRLLWEDRKQLNDDQLASFLSTSAELARQLLIEGPKYSSHIISIQSFLQVVELNLSGLNSRYRMYFNSFKVYGQRLVSKYETVRTLDTPEMSFKLIQCASILVVAQPTVLKHYIPIIIEQLNIAARDSYFKIMNDVTTFDLHPDESHNRNDAILRCIIQEQIPPQPEDKTAPELLSRILPIISLQYGIGRLVSEFVPVLIHIVLWLNTFVEAISYSVLASFDIKDEKFELYETWLPHTSCDAITNVINNTADLPEEAKEILTQCSHQNFYLNLPELSNHCQAKIVLESICSISQLAFNYVSLSINNDLWNAMSGIPQMYIAAQLFLEALRQIMLLPTYFTVPPIYLAHKKNLETIREGAKTLFETGNVNNVFITDVMLFNTLLKKVRPICVSTDLSELYPLENIDIPTKLLDNLKVDRREDMAEMIGEYRVLKNELAECILLHEKDNVKIVVERIQQCVSKISALENYIHPGNELTEKIENGYSQFVSQLPYVYTYRLHPLILREILDKLDVPIDQCIDDVAAKLYEHIDPEGLNDLSVKIEGNNYEPSERKDFIQSFSETLKPLLGQVQDEYELQLLYEILMLIQDNRLSEVKYIVKTLSEEKKSSLLECISGSPYTKYVRSLEKCAELVNFDNDLPVWYKSNVCKIVDSLKLENTNETALNAVKKLTDVNAHNDVHKCIDDALEEYKTPELEALHNLSEQIKNNKHQLEESYQDFQNRINGLKDYKGCTLLYKDCSRRIIDLFYHEFLLQDWEPSLFASLCHSLILPANQQFSPEAVAKALITARRKLRSIRLMKQSVHSKFVTECDNTLSNSENQLREFFNNAQKSQTALQEKQKEIIKGVEKEFAALPESNLRIFLSHLIHNVFLDIETQDIPINANQFANEIRTIRGSFSLDKLRANQVNSVIAWLQTINRDILPIDYDKLIVILKKLLETLATISDDQLFEYDQDVLMDIAIKLSDVLGKLSALRYSVILIKDMHKLYSIKDALMLFISTVIRTFEAYAEEIHTFPIKKHPIISLIETAPKMCEKLETLIEASFMLQSIKRHCEEAIESINEFYESCPDDVKESMQAAIQVPIKAIESLNAE